MANPAAAPLSVLRRFHHALRPAGELLALAALFASLATLWPAAWRPAEKPAPAAAASAYSITVTEARTAPVFKTALWLDARPAAAFAAGHIPGALRLTEAEWEPLFLPLIDQWTPGTPIVVYCDTIGCQASEQVAARLRRELAFEQVFHLVGGWQTWNQNP